MDATHHALGADHLPPPAPSAPAPTPAHAKDLTRPGRSSTPATRPGRSSTPATRPGRSSTPATRPGLRGRLSRAVKESVWAAVAAKASAIAVGMLGLAAIGAWSTLAGAGVPVNTAVLRASADPKGAWLAPEHAAQRPSPAAIGTPNVGASGSASASEGAAPPAAASPDPSARAAPGVTADGKIVLNTATVEELVKLPRVGPKRAQAIVELRKRLGKFRKPTDLLRVRGIGRKTLVLILPKVVVDAPAE
jgi:competence protein ComEA